MSSTPDLRVSVPLQSDPPWIGLGVLATLAASNGLFVWLFSGTRLNAALGLLPGMTLAVFVGSALAAWGRRRGGSLDLALSAFRAEVRARDARHELLDLTAPYAALLLRGRNASRRMLVVSQHEEPTVLIEPGHGTDAPDAEVWRARTVQADLDAVAVSPSSARVLTLATGASLDPVLAHLARSVEPGAPWFSHPTHGGAPVRVDAREISFGARTVPISGSLKVLDYAIGPKGAAVAAIGFAGDEGALLLFGCEDAPLIPGAVVSDLVPDAYLPPTGFELLRAVTLAAIEEARRGERG